MNSRVVVLAFSAALALGCGGSTDPVPPPPPPPPPPAANAVTVASNTFTPTPLNASARGATVTWTWAGGSHNVAFEDNVNNSPDQNQTTGTHQRTFNNAGTFRYRCTNHSTAGNFTSGMVGSVVVP